MKFYGLNKKEIEAVKAFITNKDSLRECKVYKSDSETITIEHSGNKLKVGAWW